MEPGSVRLMFPRFVRWWVSGRVTVEQVAQLRRFAVGEAASTTLGRQWGARVRPVAPELVALYSGLPVVRERVERALALVAGLASTPQTRVDDDVLDAAGEALTAIDRSASPALARVTEAARRELSRTRHKTLREVVGL